MNCVNLNNELSVIIVSGLEVKGFLQGQLTNDINLLDNQPFQYSAYLNTKGRMLASFWVKKVADNQYYLITSKAIVDKLILKLRMYILRAKVTIEKLATNIYFTDDISSFTSSINIPIAYNRYIVITNNIIDSINQTIDYFKQTIIENGIAIIYPETQEQLIPQHVNYDELGGLNFKKGCYLGQEIVARMHYLGKSKRKMYHFTTSHVVKIGQMVVSPQLNNQEVG
ncbi:MAG: hypothetical protein K2P99_00760, partial [Burkholderiales bacterium]|nr:hypothetical protein [Burkholderiales bacterium]